MLKYILKRILLFLPTLFVISFIAFWLGTVAPGDPVMPHLPIGDSRFELTGEIFKETYEKLGLNKPMFYITISSAAYPDTLYKIPGRHHKDGLSNLINQYGNWKEIQTYNNAVENYCRAIDQLPEAINKNKRIKIRRSANLLLEEYKDSKINSFLQAINKHVFEQRDSLLIAQLGTATRALNEYYANVKNNQTKYKLYLPAIRWQGLDNQYHHWFAAFLTGDFGLSYRSLEPVLDRIKTPISWTLIINLMVISLVFILAIPLGVFSAVKKDSWMDKITTTGLFFLFSLPSFWIGTMLLVFFTNPEYGMNWFEGAGLGILSSKAPFWDRFWETASHLLLPVLCLTYGSLAFISRQMRGSILNVLNLDYIRTAQAKGLNSRQVVWKHAFRNSLFPLITIFARILPTTIAGSVLVEVIFNIPGMGREVLSAISSRDWPVLYTILMLVAILTLIGNLLADILYAYADPRVKFK